MSFAGVPPGHGLVVLWEIALYWLVAPSSNPKILSIWIIESKLILQHYFRNNIIDRGNFCSRSPVRGVRHFWARVEATGGNVLWPRSKRHRHCHLRWHGQKWTAPSSGWARQHIFTRKYTVLQGDILFWLQWFCHVNKIPFKWLSLTTTSMLCDNGGLTGKGV